jgi:hypothetical protein
MHGPGGHTASWFEDSVNETLLDAVEGGMPALLRYAAEVEGIRMPSADEALELLADAERELEFVHPSRIADLWLSIDHLRGQLDAVPARVAVAA